MRSVSSGAGAVTLWIYVTKMMWIWLMVTHSWQSKKCGNDEPTSVTLAQHRTSVWRLLIFRCYLSNLRLGRHIVSQWPMVKLGAAQRLSDFRAVIKALGCPFSGTLGCLGKCPSGEKIGHDHAPRLSCVTYQWMAWPSNPKSTFLTQPYFLKYAGYWD